jgi:hypothetical protein
MRIFKRSVSAPLFLCGIILSAFILVVDADAETCGGGKRPLYFYTTPSLSDYLSPAFSDRLLEQLHEPLEDIGYCIMRFDSTVLYDMSVQDDYIMVIAPDTGSTRDRESGEFSSYFSPAPFIHVALVRVDIWSAWEIRKALKAPLLSLPFNRSELSTFESVLIRKIEENLRKQYICHLNIQSVPEGAKIRTENGLEGVSPLEWILPMGRVGVTAELEGFKPIHRTIRLKEPGRHTYVLQMSKRQFYNSSFFISSMVLGGLSIGSYAMTQYYYNIYRQLGRTDREHNPGAFKHNFHRAQQFEQAAAISAVLGGISLGFSFIF